MSSRRLRALVGLLVGLLAGHAASPEFEVRLEAPLIHDDGQFLWYHPRAAPIARPGQKQPGVVVTLQQHLRVSDYYGGLHTLECPSLDAPWPGKPTAIPELDWRPQPDGTTISVADVTPGWHARTRRLIALGCEVPYSRRGEQLDERPRQHQTVYAVFDPAAARWTRWSRLEMPPGPEFDFSRNACSQWVVRPDDRVLVPVYHGRNTREPWKVTVAECDFDGTHLRYRRHGDDLALPVARGLYEPSLVAFHGRHFLTLRNDERGYVTSGRDGLHWAPVRPWTFDDGTELGSYNTQQHWLAHSDALYLVYTRRGAGNDHIPRHRAPLFLARVDPERLQVIRATERIIIPEHGAELGNFGCAAMDARESWITVSEGVWGDDARRRGARGATYVARILWSQPNRLAPFP